MKTRVILIMASVLVALAVVLYFTNRSEPQAPKEPPRPFVWRVDMLELSRIALSLPRDGKSEAWAKRSDKLWYFDKPEGPKVDMKRWGGGVPLLLSGPAANRLITGSATEEQLAMYGLVDPRMAIELYLENGNTLGIELGDVTPDGKAYYIRMVDSQKVFTVDHTWYDLLEGLVLDPPYPDSEDG